MAFEFGPAVRANFEVIVQHNRLPVQHKESIFRVTVQDSQQAVNQPDQLEAVLLEG